jgi:hypothetical protein
MPNEETEEYEQGQTEPNYDSETTVEYGGESLSTPSEESNEEDVPLNLPKRHKPNTDPESSDDSFVSPFLDVGGPSGAGEDMDDETVPENLHLGPSGLDDTEEAAISDHVLDSLIENTPLVPPPAPVVPPAPAPPVAPAPPAGPHVPPPAPPAPPLPPAGHFLHPIHVVPGGVPTWPIRPRTGGRRRGATHVRLGENHPQEDTMPTRTRGGIQ